MCEMVQRPTRLISCHSSAALTCSGRRKVQVGSLVADVLKGALASKAHNSLRINPPIYPSVHSRSPPTSTMHCIAGAICLYADLPCWVYHAPSLSRSLNIAFSAGRRAMEGSCSRLSKGKNLSNAQKSVIVSREGKRGEKKAFEEASYWL